MKVHNFGGESHVVVEGELGAMERACFHLAGLGRLVAVPFQQWYLALLSR